MALFVLLAHLDILPFPERVSEPPKDGETTIVALDVADIVERSNPAVVSVVVSRDVPVLEEYDEDPFSEFFGGSSPFRFRVPRLRQNGTERQEVGSGSGFFISEDGYVVTNAHVVADNEATYSVFTNSGDTYEARVVARDTLLDIAVLDVEGSGFPSLSFGDSDTLRLGEAVIVIGNALGEFQNTVSTGVVSGLSRSIVAGNGAGMSEALPNVIQTDAAINPGNSGGPLLNLTGEVVGVSVAVARGSENIGFALPSNAVRQSVESIIEHGRVVRAYLGVRYMMVTESLAEKNGLSVNYGALILRGESGEDLAIIPGSPADKAGLEENDIVLEVGGVRVEGINTLSLLVQSRSVGERITLKVLHDGVEREVTVVLEESPSE